MDFITFVSHTSIAFIAIAAPIVIALVQIVKNVGLTKRYTPIVALVLGLTVGLSFGGYTTLYNALLGVLTGLTACGLWAGSKTVKNG